MATTKVAITIESELLVELDRLVSQQVFPNRSRAIQASLRDTLSRLRQQRLATECAKLDPRFEQALAEEGIALDADEWPEY
jgi:metal-responsive CopG/Arc/MetJ family transcriptional regulator